MDFIVFVVNFLFSLGYLLLIIRAIMPWLPGLKIKLVTQLTDPVLNVVRLGLPPSRLGMDVSPFVIMMVLLILQRLIVGALLSL